MYLSLDIDRALRLPGDPPLGDNDLSHDLEIDLLSLDNDLEIDLLSGDLRLGNRDLSGDLDSDLSL